MKRNLQPFFLSLILVMLISLLSPPVFAGEKFDFIEKIIPKSGENYTLEGDVLFAQAGENYWVWTREKLMVSGTKEILDGAAALAEFEKKPNLLNTRFDSGESAAFAGGEITLTEKDGSFTVSFGGEKPWDFFYYGKVGEGWTPEVFKVLEGRTLKEKEFTFELKDAEGKKLRSAQNTKEGKVLFGALLYKEEDIGKTFTYTLSEVPGSDEGILYDTTVMEIEVKITKSLLPKEKLKIDVKYPFNRIFTNKVKKNLQWTPEVTKELSGRILKDGEFSFELRDEEDRLIETVTNDQDGRVLFSPLSYGPLSADRTYIYRISEKAGKEEGMSYDPLVVEVRAILDPGKLSLVYSEDTTFNNRFSVPAQWVPEVTKILTGRTLKDQEFSFELRDDEGNLIETAKNNAEGRVLFSPILYSQEDEGKSFTYTLREGEVQEEGMEIDPMILQVNVQVLSGPELEVTYDEDPIFHNRIKATGSWTPELTKVLQGRTLKDQEFSFELHDEKGNLIESVKNDKEGRIFFSPLVYSEEDIGKSYRYLVREEKGSLEGMSYSDLTMAFTAEIQEAAGGKLKINVSEPEDKTFTNVFRATVSWTPELTKVLQGRALKDQEFSFELRDEKGNLIESVKNDEEGRILFSPLSYSSEDREKSFTYKIQELKGTEEGMNYDDSVIPIRVDVTGDDEGKLKIQTIYPEDKTFHNRYKSTGSWTPELTKVLQGRLLKDKEFRFELYDDKENFIESVKNDSGGNIRFRPLVYSEEDIGKSYRYRIREEKGSEEGMHYDDKTVEIVAEIQDAGGGKLKIKTTYPEDKVFKNVYRATAQWKPEATKELKGRSLRDGEFSFELKDGQGKVLQSAKNNEKGKVYFEALTFTQEDIGKSFSYTLSEVKGSDKGVSYDTKVITYRVKVKEGKKGKLELEVNASGEPKFINSYTRSGEALLEIEKILLNDKNEPLPLGSKVFDFEVYEGEKKVASGKNDYSGKVSFTPIAYSEKDIGKTFVYTLKEVPGSLGGIVYATETLEVRVRVSDTGEGKLHTEISYPKGKTIKNKYLPKLAEITLQAKKKLVGKELTEKQFEFEVRDGDKRITKGTNDKDGKILFDKFHLDKAGFYRFDIVEVQGKIPGITYDTSVYKVDIKVSASGDGSLVATVSYPKEVLFENVFSTKKIDVTVYKKWVNLQGQKPKIKLQLYRNGVALGEPVELKDATRYTWKDLEEKDAEGKTFTYSVKEIEVPKNYTASYSEDGWTITNTFNKDKLAPTGERVLGGLILAGGALLGLAYILLKKKKQE